MMSEERRMASAGRYAADKDKRAELEILIEQTSD
jgi:hypothetical protein